MSRTPTRTEAIASELRDEITSGALAVGEALPTQIELSERFGVSRFTIRAAVQRLEDQGLVVSRQGASTRVVHDRPRLLRSVEMSTETDVLNYAAGTVLVTDESWLPAMDGQVAEVELDPGTRWLTLEAVRRIGPDGPPIGVSRLCVDARHEAALASVEVSGSSAIFLQLAEQLGLTGLHIEQELYASRLDPRIARRLGASDEEPALVVLRRFVADEVGLYLAARTVHPAERFRFRQRLRSG